MPLSPFAPAAPVVAPFAGAWIEIYCIFYENMIQYVAPFAGAWIEIYVGRWKTSKNDVAPFAGAWIEILSPFRELSLL